MSWVDDEDYFGPDRREGARLRLIERRRADSGMPAPSLPLLLRKLRHWAADAVDAGSVDRYRARVQSVAKLACERGQDGAAAWLRALDDRLAAAPPQRTIAELCNQHLQRALAALT